MFDLFLFIVLFFIPFVINVGLIYADLTSFGQFSILHQKVDYGTSILLGILASISSWVGVLAVICMTELMHHGWKLPGINTPWLKD